MTKKFSPPHKYVIANKVNDEETMQFLNDALSVYSSLFQGMLPIGDWIENRVAYPHDR